MQPPRRDSFRRKHPKLFAQLARDLRDGCESHRALGVKYGVSCASVTRISQQLGIKSPSAEQRVEAALARSAHKKVERIALTDEIFSKVEELLPYIENAYDLDLLVSAYAKAVDARLLEEGRLIERTETTCGSLERKLAGLAQALSRR